MYSVHMKSRANVYNNSMRLKYFLYRFAFIYWHLLKPLTLGVRVLLIKDGKVLLVKHTYRPGWFFPGGGVKRGESHWEAAVREVREETGCRIGNMTLLGTYVYTGEGKFDNVICFVSEDFNQGPYESSEIAETAWFDLNSLPENMFSGSLKRIEEYKTGSYPVFGHW
jgi:8-oxo-dGTP pyrophosphatase MutT (NUDIX family)